MIQVTLTSTTNLHSLEEFRNLVVKSVNGANVRLSDVAQVVLGADSYEAQASRSTARPACSSASRSRRPRIC